MAEQYTKSKTRIALSPGDAVRIAREMLGWSQNTLAKRCGIPQSTISAIESSRVSLGVDRAKKLARSLSLHPAALLFPVWDLEKESTA